MKKRWGGGGWVFLGYGSQWRLFLIPFHQLVLHSNEMKSLSMFTELGLEWIQWISIWHELFSALNLHLSSKVFAYFFIQCNSFIKNIFLLFSAFLLSFLRGTFSKYRSFILKICFFLLLRHEIVGAYYHSHSVILNIISCNLSKFTFRKLPTHRFWREKKTLIWKCVFDVGAKSKAEILRLSRLGPNPKQTCSGCVIGYGQSQSRHALDVF
jgi:hypothetical protein